MKKIFYNLSLFAIAICMALFALNLSISGASNAKAYYSIFENDLYFRNQYDFCVFLIIAISITILILLTTLICTFFLKDNTSKLVLTIISYIILAILLLSAFLLIACFLILQFSQVIKIESTHNYSSIPSYSIIPSLILILLCCGLNLIIPAIYSSSFCEDFVIEKTTNNSKQQKKLEANIKELEEKLKQKELNKKYEELLRKLDE